MLGGQAPDGGRPDAGHSILSWLPQRSAPELCRAAASLAMLLPAQHCSPEQGELPWVRQQLVCTSAARDADVHRRTGRQQLQATLETWLAAPVTGHLREAEAQQLLSGASRLAGQALGAAPSPGIAEPQQPSLPLALLGKVCAACWQGLGQLLASEGLERAELIQGLAAVGAPPVARRCSTCQRWLSGA